MIRFRGRAPRTDRAGAAAGLLVLLAAVGCASRLSETRVGPGTVPAPGQVWVPRPADVPSLPRPSKPPEIPPDLLRPGRDWTLIELVDLALRTNPATKAAWAAARAAAADLGSQKGAYWPEIDLDATASRSKSSFTGGKTVIEQTSYGPSVALSYLLLDCGGRRATVEESREALIAANFAYNATIQEVVLSVEDAYYRYVQATALAAAQRATVEDAKTNLDAAEQRRAAGVATIADVLQARTALSQSRLTLTSVEGQIETIRGLLATTAGLPANTKLDVALPSSEVPTEKMSEDVDRLIEDAKGSRPDLASSRSLVLEAEAHRDRIRAEGLPTLGATASYGRLFYPGEDARDVWTGVVAFRFPVFTGHSQTYKQLQSRAELDRARAQLEGLEQQVVYDVWSSYYDLRTATTRVGVSADLLASASESSDVALGRYKAGVGSILDLLSAQQALALARAEQVAAKTDWFQALARLARATGRLWPASSPGGPTPSAAGDARGRP